MKTDFLIIGSGIAGLNLAIKASRLGKVLVVTKKKMNDCNTSLAQGGLAAVFSKEDSFRLHYNDTLRAGDGICRKEAVKLLVEKAPSEIMFLDRLKVPFDKEDSRLSLSKEAVHSEPRIVHAGDITGEEVERTLIGHVRKNRNIRVIEECAAVRLIVDNNECSGALIR